MSDIPYKLFNQLSAFVDSDSRKQIEQYKNEKKISASALASIALYNELACDNPFDMNMNLDADYVADISTKEIKQLTTKLLSFGSKISMPYALLFHKDFGVDDMEHMRRLLTEMRDKGVITCGYSMRRQQHNIEGQREIRVVNSSPLSKPYAPVEPAFESTLMVDSAGHSWYLWPEGGMAIISGPKNMVDRTGKKLYPNRLFRNFLKEQWGFKWKRSTERWERPIDMKPMIYDMVVELITKAVANCYWVHSPNQGNHTLQYHEEHIEGRET